MNLTSHDDNNGIMRSFIMILSVFALLVTVTVSVAHADIMLASADVTVSQDHQHTPDSDSYSDCCDMACGGCSLHCHHIASHTSDTSLEAPNSTQTFLSIEKLALSEVIYGLKRPPKS